MEFKSTFKTKLIYIFGIPDEAHKDCLKIGEATLDDWNLSHQPNSEALNAAACARIDQYTKTVGLSYNLLYTEMTIFGKDKTIHSFNDKQVHDVLLRSGIKRKEFLSGGSEWFVCDLATAIKAIEAVKQGRLSLSASEVSAGKTPIMFRPEQRHAIDKTLKQFAKGNNMLWNAKMRFGKTLSALQVVKEMPSFRRTLILTHRPVVDSGWFEDFTKIFYDTPNIAYGSKGNGELFHNLTERYLSSDSFRFIYFASMQDLRGSELVGGNFDKNNLVFATDWDFIIVDEAHEGTQTELGQKVLQALIRKETKVLRLSGTPFNILHEYTESEIYTWDYTMEQAAKAKWYVDHPGDHNPYASLPTLNIYTYNLGKLMSQFADSELAFNFREFFRTDRETGQFVHRSHIVNFLNLLTKEDEDSYYPFANDAYRNMFRHTLWMLPGVREAKALSALLKEHPVFQHFDIVNVAGEGDEEEASDEALSKLNKAIGSDPDATRTICLSCGRLTTGVSVKPWTGVLMLSGSYNTGAANYMQTIFRVQTPATINGRIKEDCYVFDFAPDRTLKVLAEVAKVSTKAGKNTGNDRNVLKDFLNFCPIISYDGSQMKNIDPDTMLQQLKKVYIERVVNNGFEDGYLYNDLLLELDDIELKKFDKLRAQIGTTKAQPKTNDILLNKQGFDEEEHPTDPDGDGKPKKEKLSAAEQEQRRKEAEKKKKKRDAISILRGISIRMPLLIYGANIDDEDRELTIDNFTQLVDHQSWDEFMPRGVSKHTFNSFKKYYDPDIFTAAAKRIRAMARATDSLTIEERIARITNIFATFRNPDKETVLTPWRVVNMHMADTLGGYTFFNADFSETIDEPRFVDHGKVTSEVFTPESCLLEINSKSGLYPLYLAYNIYRSKVAASLFSPATIQEHQAIWDSVVADNIFVVCKTPMARSITCRTLLGFRRGRSNLLSSPDIITKIKENPQRLVNRILNAERWGVYNTPKMNFKAVVGNPPYQEMGGSGGSNDAPIYQYFAELSTSIRPNYISLIIPSRWFAAGRENLIGDFRSRMLKCGNIRLLTTYLNSRDIFPTVEIKGGVCYYLEDRSYNGLCNYSLVNGVDVQSDTLDLAAFDILIRTPRLAKIVSTVASTMENTVDCIISSDTPFGVPTKPTNNAKVIFDISAVPTATHTTALFYIENLQRKVVFVAPNSIKKNTQDIYKHKVFIPEVGGSGYDSKILGAAEYAPPNSVCSQSYLYSAFDAELEARNFIKYLCTKFLRILVSAIKITQHASSKVYRFVPLQDFSSESDIVWSDNKEVVEARMIELYSADYPVRYRTGGLIDRQLYAKYGLSEDEIQFIESMIKPM